MFKKLLISLLLGLTVLFSVAPFMQAKAQSTWYNQSFFDWYDKVYNTNTSPSDQIFGERYTAAQVQWVVWSLLAMPINFLGSDGQTIVLCFMGLVNGNGNIVTCGTSALTFVKGLMDTVKISTSLGLTGEAPSKTLFAQMFDTTGRQFSGIVYV